MARNSLTALLAVMAVLPATAVSATAAPSQPASSSSSSEFPQICRAVKRSVNELHAICPIPAFERSTSFPPWTHEPFCIYTKGARGDSMCVYTNADFRSGRGISIITDAGAAEKLATSSAAGLLELQEAAVPDIPSEKLVYELREAEGKGTGVFIKQNLEGVVKAGRTIAVEFPTLAVQRETLTSMKPEDMEELQWLAAVQLPGETRRKTRALARSQGGGMDEIEDLLKTNSLGQSFGETRYVSLFPVVARINHACIPNAFYRFNESTMALTVFALRDIQPGEEVTITYLESTVDLSREKRQALLAEHWNFHCACSLCSASSEEVSLSDDRRSLIGAAKEKIRLANGRARNLYRAATQLAYLYEEEGLIAPRARANEIAAYASSMVGDENETRRFANAAKRYWRILAGKESAEVQMMDLLRRDPMGHPSWKAQLKASPEEEAEARQQAAKEAGEEFRIPTAEELPPPEFTIED